MSDDTSDDLTDEQIAQREAKAISDAVAFVEYKLKQLKQHDEEEEKLDDAA